MEMDILYINIIIHNNHLYIYIYLLLIMHFYLYKIYNYHINFNNLNKLDNMMYNNYQLNNINYNIQYN